VKERITLVEAAKQAALSRDKAKYWLELLGCCLIKEKRKSFVPMGAVVLLEAMRLAVETGLTPSAAAEHVKITYSEQQAPIETVKDLEVPNDAITKMTDRIEGLEKAVLMLVEENRALNQKVGKLQGFLMPPRKSDIQVIPWQPERPANLLKSMTWYRRVWVTIFQPWKMRQHGSQP